MPASIPISANSVADLIIFETTRRGLPALSNRKLQKLLYFVQLYHLGLYGFKAFDDPLKAWADGPVLPNVRMRFIRPGLKTTINKNEIDWPQTELTARAEPSIYDAVTRVTLDFGNLVDKDLIELTHGQRPWINARQTAAHQIAIGHKVSPTINDNDMKTLSRTITRHLPRQKSQKDFSRAEALYAASGDIQLQRSKASLADAAGTLSEALALRFDPERIADARIAFARKLSDFTTAYRLELTLEPSISQNEGFDLLANEIVDYGMGHRQR
jgi:uncharacterized phage-associated protein